MSSAQKLTIGLSNASHSNFAVLEELQIIWPVANERLCSIALNGSTIYDVMSAWSPDGLSIDAWKGQRSLRLLAPGQKATLSFEFEGTASTDLGTYDLRLGFGGAYLQERTNGARGACVRANLC